ncbi:glycoside hydrolase family 65 protein [Cellulosimicrobium sp. NPDC057127]|uniref:glycoside hydrolase family 65 protein n=1 Tax=Cellulosimicrobium sp. NPDC057127 TaxID=3346026 RepID=UPI0036355D15
MTPSEPDPWSVREADLDLEPGAVASVLSLANGFVGVRGVLDEVGPGEEPATLVAPVFEEYDQTYAEGGYAYPEVEERLVPVVDAWRLGWSVDGEPVDVRAGTVHEHRRELDLRHGVLDRELRWTAPSGATVTLTSRRLVSLVRREIVATWWQVQAEDDVTVTVLPAPDCPHGGAGGDDRPGHDGPGHDGPAGDGPRLVTVTCRHDAQGSSVDQRAVRSGRALAVETAHLVECSDGVTATWDDAPRAASLTARLRAGDRLRVLVLAAHAAGTETGALAARAHDALTAAGRAGWDELQHEQRRFLAEVWERGDVVVEGDDEMQQAVRHALFSVVQASAQVRDVGVRAKGMTGTGYAGHAFWDSECFVLPVLDHVLPAAAADHLRWRHQTLPLARDRAAELGLPGASFPWRTISGRECSGYWPAGTAAFHVNAAVACAAARHVAVTGDEVLERESAVDLVVETARLWAGRGHHTAAGFRIDGVTGPDEYTAVVDNNTYTNLMAAANLRHADALCERHPQEAGRLGVTTAEREAWLRAASRMIVPYNAELRVTEQSQDFTRHAPWHFEPRTTARFPLDQHVPYVELYRHQVVKQADLVLALHTASDAFSPEQKLRDFDYYEPLTVRDSSLSAPAQAVVAAEVGYVDLAYDYARECALLDLCDLRASTDGGLHVASLAGAWTALVAGLGGLRHADDGLLHLAPRLPSRLRRLAFAVRQGDARITVDVRGQTVTYRLTAGDEARLTHHGEKLRLTAASPQERRHVPPGEVRTPPAQPPGRDPLFAAS